MLDLKISELSPDAGAGDDGIVRGSVAQSPFVKVMSNVQTAQTIYAIRKDVQGSTFSFTDVSDVAASDDPNSFEPWGSNIAMSAGDELYVACQHSIIALCFDIDTPAVWAGAGLEIAYSNNGTTANTVIPNLVDGTNGFKNSDGIYKVSFTPPSDIREFSPVPGSIASRQWLVLRPRGITAVTTSPKLKRMWILHDASAITYTDFTSVSNAQLTSNDFTGVPATMFITEGNELIMGLPYLAYGIDITVHKKMLNAAEHAHEYLAADNTWKSLPSFSDPSNDFENGPAALGTVVNYKVRWSVPQDWNSVTKDFSGVGNVTAYFIRYRVTTINQLGLTEVPLWRGRVRAFGENNSTGIKIHSAVTFKGLSIGHIGIPNATQAIISFTNINNGKSTSVTIPANPTAPMHFDFSPELAIGAGQQLLVAHQSGGSLGDVEIHLQA